MRLALAAFLLVILGLLSAACGASGPSDTEVLTSLADEAAVPAFQAVAQDMARLDEATQALCQTPSGMSLSEAREAWRTARASWMMSEAMWFGPVMDRRSRSLLDWSPTNIEGIERVLARGATVTPDDVGQTMASNQRGLGAIEYVLFDDKAPGSLAGTSPHCPFLTALTAVVREEAENIESAWTGGIDGSPAYKDYLTGRSGVALLAGEGVAEVVRTQYFLIRDIVDMRLASALGLRDDPPDLTAIPGTSSDNGLEDVRNELIGMQEVYIGAAPEGLGISHLVQPLSADADQRVREQFAAAIAAVDAVEGPLKVAIVERPEQVLQAHGRLSDLQRTIGTEIVSLLGVSLGFTDTDGDTLR